MILCKIQLQNWTLMRRSLGRFGISGVNYNMYGLLLNMSSDFLGFGPGSYLLLGEPLGIG